MNVVDNAVYRLSISLCVPQIFAVKVESCPKSHRILDIFGLPDFNFGEIRRYPSPLNDAPDKAGLEPCTYPAGCLRRRQDCSSCPRV